MVMRIILSPAKKMKEDLDGPAPLGLPRYLERTQQLLAYLRGLDLPALRKLLWPAMSSSPGSITSASSTWTWGGPHPRPPGL